MKLFVMIPAYNEEKTLPLVIREIPREIQGIDSVNVLVINDGSTDNTFEMAVTAGADYVISNKKNLGLAKSFRRGMIECLKRGADIIVNTDADFQYDQSEISRIIRPIFDGKADVVLTDRQVWNLSHMPLSKKIGNTVATYVTRMVSGFKVRDAQSGFRAFSREAALKLNVLSDYTYVQETIMQAIDKDLKIMQLPCRFRKRSGKSRLISSLLGYAKKAGSFMVRSYIRYKPLKVFLTVGLIPFLIGLLLGIRFLIFYFSGAVGAHIQSLILAAVLMIVGFQVIVMALIADTIDFNRRINEEMLYRIKKMKFR